MAPPHAKLVFRLYFRGLLFEPVFASIQFIMLQDYEMDILKNVVVTGEVFLFGQGVTGS